MSTTLEQVESHLDEQHLKLYLHYTGIAIWTICKLVLLAVYYILCYLALGIVFISKLLYQPVGFLLQPVLYLGRFVLALLLVPFQLLVKLEVRIQ